MSSASPSLAETCIASSFLQINNIHNSKYEYFQLNFSYQSFDKNIPTVWQLINAREVLITSRPRHLNPAHSYTTGSLDFLTSVCMMLVIDVQTCI